MPDQLLSNLWSSQFGGQSAKAAPSSNALLTQVPGNYYNHPHVSHVPDLKALLHNPNASNAAGAIDLTRAYSPLGGAAALPKYPSHGLSASSGVEQSSLGALFLNKSSNARGNLPGEGSAIDGMSHGAMQFQDSTVHMMQKLPSKSIPRHHHALLMDRMRVSCLNVGGEFFVGESGIFGVLCSCHQLRMSVAKFCEHAGGPAEKAGEIVLMNGMSIAQWFKYCAGVEASVTDTKWDWPEWVFMDYSPEGYMMKSLLTRNTSMEKIGLFSAYGNITGPITGAVYSNDFHNEGREFTTVEKLVNKQHETYYKKSADVHTTFTKNYTLLQNSEKNLGLDKNHTGNAASINPVSRPSGSVYITEKAGGSYKGDHLSHNYAGLLEKNFDASFRNPTPRSTGVLSYDSMACRSYFPNKILQNSLGSSSNTELKLGQSSYDQSMTSLFPSVQSTTIDFQKPQSHLPSITQNPCPRQTTKVNKSIGEHTEPPLGTRTKKQSIEVANGINRSEGDELTDDRAKGSFISLFLSHLERNSEAINDILKSNEHNRPKALDGAYSSNHSKIASGQVDLKANEKHSKLASTIIHTKRRSDGSSLSVAPSGHVSKVVPLANSQGPLIHSDCRSHFLPRQPNAGISQICARVSCPANCRSCNHISEISHEVEYAETGAPCLYDKMAREHGSFERVDDLHTHRSLRVDKIICQHGNSCSSSRELLPSFDRNDQPTLGKSIYQCCCKVQGVVSRHGYRAGHLCQTHFSNNGAPIHKPTVEVLNELCTCSTFIPRSSLCSREHMLQSSCHECPFDGFHCRSSMEHATSSLTKCPLLDAPNKHESGPRWDGKCCYCLVPKCLAGCGFTKHCEVRVDQSDSTLQKCKHDLQLSATCCTLGESEKSRCQCSNNAQTCLLEDACNKITNQPHVPIMERLKNVSEESVSNGIWPYRAVTEKKVSPRGFGVCKEQLKPVLSSGSSSAMVTKFSASPEFSNISSCMAKFGVERKKLMFDEGSRTEKFSSSSYAPTSTGCESEKVLNSSSGFHLGASKMKRKCNQISDRSTLKENEKAEQCLETRKKSRRLKCSAEHSESDDCTRKITLQSSQNKDSQPQNEANSNSCRVSKIKRKHSTMQQNKPVKRRHSHHKTLEGAEQLDNEAMVGELNSSDEKKIVEDMITLDRTKYQQEGNQVFVRKLPKYVSLNCISNEHNRNDACDGGLRLESSLIATGMTNDNRRFPKIVPLNLILKRAKRCHVFKPPLKTQKIHFREEKSAVCSVVKYSFVNRNYSPQDEEGIQGSRKNRYSSNALKPHPEPDCKRPCNGVKNRRSGVSLNRIKRCEESAIVSACSPCEVNVGRSKERLSSDDSCCVCGSPCLEPCNQLIQCSKCYIKVHQACYGVLKVPRGQWFCRPCKTKTNTEDMVCVLCGYGGGAMTRALNTQRVLRSLLKGLRVTAQSDKDGRHNPVSRSTSLNTVSQVDKQKSIDSAHEENTVSSSWTGNHNSSLLGPQTMQWIHVVCGLWTPGTKCPKSTTMCAFDISGALPAKENSACSVCNRTGGSFMMCRDISCSVMFHSWCAHQRGLLQSEPEGELNENIGFYGRCLNHATLEYSDRVNPEKEHLRSNDWTCARTEGFKGRKGEGWSGSNYKKPQESYSECSVSQEQINAWLRINGSKPCIRGQLKGQKHLVVYKSGIHGLGLYTSEFIPRGSMVIEYVGEIVGQRVADKREIEYHSGKRQQYKSVCYFFKIDREHIIDATQKGGVARFINHSCQPNCVAKIISVRNEKKVVFFSERQINPGEEITYDYHFTQEDEGQRIPCFCRSRSCRRYLN